MFVRVRDKDTGHQLDVPETDPRIGGPFELLNRKTTPPSPVVRRPKHKLPRTRGVSTTTPPDEPAEKEA